MTVGVAIEKLDALLSADEDSIVLLRLAYYPGENGIEQMIDRLRAEFGDRVRGRLLVVTPDVEVEKLDSDRLAELGLYRTAETQFAVRSEEGGRVLAMGSEAAAEALVPRLRGGTVLVREVGAWREA